jgi:hypothetical protein
MNNVKAFQASKLQDLSNGILGGPLWYSFTFPTKLLNIRDSRMSAAPKWECTWESLGSIPCILPHLWECVSHLNTLFWPHGPLHSTLSHEPNVRVATWWKKLRCLISFFLCSDYGEKIYPHLLENLYLLCDRWK